MKQWVNLPGHVGQLVTCLATDASLIADPGVARSNPAWSHNFVEIDHEIISTLILLPSAESFRKGCCQLQAKVRYVHETWLTACSILPVLPWLALVANDTESTQ